MSQSLAHSFSEEDNRAKEEEMLNDPCHIVSTQWHWPPCCTVSKSAWEWDSSLHILWLVQSQLGNYVLNKWGDPLSVTQSQMRSWDANPGLLPARPGLLQTWLLPNLSCFLRDADRGQEHRLRSSIFTLKLQLHLSPLWASVSAPVNRANHLPHRASVRIWWDHAHTFFR